MNFKNISLNEFGYITDSKLENQVRVCLTNKPIAGAFLYGPAGSGKTYLAEVLCQIESGKKYFYQMFPGSREDDLLVKILPSNNTTSGVSLNDGVIIQATKNLLKNPHEITYIILDEWDKSRPSADSFLLDFLQNGRVSFNSFSAQLTEKELKNLRVFITLNNEREISEPLLRRLPMINFFPMPTKIVKQALEKTHANHPYLQNALILYEKSLKAGMSKPATIQELRQLLDAINILGDEADWNTLVFQFITKTIENHILICNVQDGYVEAQIPEVDPSEFEERQEDNDFEYEYFPKMPKLVEKNIEPPKSQEIVPEDLNEKIMNSYSNIALTDDSYNIVTKPLSLEKDKVDETLEIVNERILLKNNFIPMPANGDCGEILSGLLVGDEVFLNTDKIIETEDIKIAQLSNIIQVTNITEENVFFHEKNAYCIFNYKYNIKNKTLEIIVSKISNESYSHYSKFFDNLNKINKNKETKKIVIIRPSLQVSEVERVSSICNYLDNFHTQNFGWGNNYHEGSYSFISENNYNIVQEKEDLEKLKNLKRFLEELKWAKENGITVIDNPNNFSGYAAELRINFDTATVKYSWTHKESNVSDFKDKYDGDKLAFINAKISDKENWINKITKQPIC